MWYFSYQYPCEIEKKKMPQKDILHLWRDILSLWPRKQNSGMPVTFKYPGRLNMLLSYVPHFVFTVVCFHVLHMSALFFRIQPITRRMSLTLTVSDQCDYILLLSLLSESWPKFDVTHLDDLHGNDLSFWIFYFLPVKWQVFVQISMLWK